MIDNVRIGRAIRTLREKVGLTQQELADRLFVSKMAVSKWERGKSVPDIQTLRALSLILDMDVDGLLEGSATYMEDDWQGILIFSEEDAFGPDRLIFDKPIIDYLISYLMLAGIREIIVASTTSQWRYIQSRYRSGVALGVRLMRVSPAELTIGSVLKSAGGRAGKVDYMVVSAPFFIYGVNLSRFLSRTMQHQSMVVNLTTVVGQTLSDSPVVNRAADGKALVHYHYRSIPFFFLQSGALLNEDVDEGLVRYLIRHQAEGRAYYEPLDKGFVTDKFDSEAGCAKIAEFVALIQEMCGCALYCPLEIAWRRGLIDRDHMRAEATAFPEYADYVDAL